LWKWYLRLPKEERKNRSQVTEISQKKEEITIGLAVGNLVTQQRWNGPVKTIENN